MHSRTWKKFETKTARRFGYERALMKGTDTKEDAAPAEGAESARWVIDAKLRTALNIWKWMDDLVKYASEKDKPAILVFSEYNKRGDYAVVEWRWFRANFKSHITFFFLQPWDKRERRNFEKAWAHTYQGAGENRIPGLLMGIEKGDIDYVCIKAENLISLMKAKGLLEVSE